MNLPEASYQLAEEIRDGRWKHVQDLAVKPAPDCEDIIQELQRRCPGHSRQDYRTAIAKGLFESR
jgi:hypothetical protein